MSTPPIILVPGFWLGAWAWDEVAELLRADGHDVTAMTLPGLESVDVDRSRVRLADHARDITKAVMAADGPVILVVHDGAGAAGYWASDRAAARIAHMVYVDGAPATGPLDPSFIEPEKPLPSWEDMAADPGMSVDGIPQAKLDEFRKRAVPEPSIGYRGAPLLNSNGRLDIPSTIVATTASAEDYRKRADEGMAWLGGILELRNLDFIELPTSHWPMWSKPRELATIISDIAKSHASSEARAAAP